MSDSNGVARDGESVLILTWDHKQATLTIGGKIANKTLALGMLEIAGIEFRAQIADERHGGRVAVVPPGVLKLIGRREPS